MDFYERKKKGHAIISSGLAKGKTREEIVFELESSLGLSDSFYDRRMKRLETIQKLQEEGISRLEEQELKNIMGVKENGNKGNEEKDNRNK